MSRTPPAESVRGRRPVRFHHFVLDEQQHIWLEDGDVLISVEWDEPYWHVVTAEYGAVQDLAVDNGRAQFDGDGAA